MGPRHRWAIGMLLGLCVGLVAALSSSSLLGQSVGAAETEWCLQASAGTVVLKGLSDGDSGDDVDPVASVESIRVERDKMLISLRYDGRIFRIEGRPPLGDSRGLGPVPDGISLEIVQPPMAEGLVPDALRAWVTARQGRLREVPWTRCFEHGASPSPESTVTGGTRTTIYDGRGDADELCENVRKGGSHQLKRPPILPVGAGAIQLTYWVHAVALFAALAFLVVWALGPIKLDDR